MGCSCIGRGKSRDAIEDEIEADKREEGGGGDGAAGFCTNTNYETLSEQELVEKVHSTYKDFLESQRSKGTRFNRENFESKFAEYVACERAYLTRLGIDHNDTEKVKSVLDPILEGAGTGSAAKAPESGVASAESSTVANIAAEEKKEEVGIQGDVAVSGSNDLSTLPEDGADAHMVTYSSESVSEQEVCSVLDSNLQEAVIDGVGTSVSCGTVGLGARDEKTLEQELKRRVLGAYRDFLECKRLEETSFGRENSESKFTQYLACEHAYLEKLYKNAQNALDEILKEEKIDSVDIFPIETELFACRVSSPSMGSGAGVKRGVLHLMMLNLWEDFLKNFPFVWAARLLRDVKKDMLLPLNLELVSPVADIKEETKSVGGTQSQSSAHPDDHTFSGYNTDGTSCAPSTELSWVSTSTHSDVQGRTRGSGFSHRYRVEVRHWCDDYQKSSLGITK